jgi:hypothetical protein
MAELVTEVLMGLRLEAHEGNVRCRSYLPAEFPVYGKREAAGTAT